jgi:hypothetical protein
MAAVMGLLLAGGCDNRDPVQAAPTACATAVVQRANVASLDDLIARSAWIVIGTVERVLPGRVPQDVGHPITEFDLHFREVLKGKPNTAAVRIRQYGGSVRGCVVQIFGYLPRPGDHGAFFLSDVRYPDGALALTAPDQGAYVLDASGRDAFMFGGREPFTLRELRTRLDQPQD